MTEKPNEKYELGPTLWSAIPKLWPQMSCAHAIHHLENWASQVLRKVERLSCKGFLGNKAGAPKSSLHRKTIYNGSSWLNPHWDIKKVRMRQKSWSFVGPGKKVSIWGRKCVATWLENSDELANFFENGRSTEERAPSEEPLSDTTQLFRGQFHDNARFSYYECRHIIRPWFYFR